MRELARYEANGQEITITDVDMRRVICDNPNVTDKEMKLFIELCKSQRLNPFIHEAHLIKYGDKPATMVVGKDVFLKRAQANPRFKGFKAGIFVIDANGKGKDREGSMVLSGEKVVGGWAKVYVDGYEEPMYDSVGFDEYAGRRRDGSLNAQWAGKPGTMIRKVALVHALREAFPESLQALYDESEMAQAMPSEPLEAEVVPEPPAQDARTQMRDAIHAYCRAAGLNAEQEMERINVPDDATDEWMLSVAENYRAAMPGAA